MCWLSHAKYVGYLESKILSKSLIFIEGENSTPMCSAYREQCVVEARGSRYSGVPGILAIFGFIFTGLYFQQLI